MCISASTRERERAKASTRESRRGRGESYQAFPNDTSRATTTSLSGATGRLRAAWARTRVCPRSIPPTALLLWVRLAIRWLLVAFRLCWVVRAEALPISSAAQSRHPSVHRFAAAISKKGEIRMWFVFYRPQRTPTFIEKPK
jgi:hypothetical protein